jgi:hypothetical protein
MKTEPTFKQLATALVAAGSAGASDRQRCEAKYLAGGLPFQFLTEAVALASAPPRPRNAGTDRPNTPMSLLPAEPVAHQKLDNAHDQASVDKVRGRSRAEAQRAGYLDLLCRCLGQRFHRSQSLHDVQRQVMPSS